MKRLVLGVFVGMLAATSAMAIDIPTYDITVTVSPSKPNGDEWDAGGEPDVFICLRDSMGMRRIGDQSKPAMRVSPPSVVTA